ncbi:MAG: HAMP domain-containing histidine kinase [Nitrosomonas sp.]|nr:HAMP domain-containing histidine kinase [Nitrosomonas sp.]UJP01015.1 MAG: HAMP domain-containing histidine kinase [Nitrosomonas sp.]
MVGISNKKQTNTASIPVVFNMANFLVSSVHDMKNSVSMLICGLDKVLTSVEAAELSTHAELVQMNHEAKRINNRLIQLLTLYKLGQKIYPFDPQSVCLDDFLRTTVAQYAQLLKFRQIHLEVRVDPALYWYFDEDLISGVIGNALNNAMRHTHDHILISAEEHEGGLMLRVEDDGDGYPLELLEGNGNVMQSVDFHGGSTGLGLYFSAMVAGMHRNQGAQGDLRLENGGSLQGACFVLHLP